MSEVSGPVPSEAWWGCNPTVAHTEGASGPRAPSADAVARARAWPEVVASVPTHTTRSTPARQLRARAPASDGDRTPEAPGEGTDSATTSGRYSSWRWQCESNHPGTALRPSPAWPG